MGNFGKEPDPSDPSTWVKCAHCKCKTPDLATHNLECQSNPANHPCMHNPDIICDNFKFSDRTRSSPMFTCNKGCLGWTQKHTKVPLPAWWRLANKVGSGSNRTPLPPKW